LHTGREGTGLSVHTLTKDTRPDPMTPLRDALFALFDDGSPHHFPAVAIERDMTAAGASERIDALKAQWPRL
jgi:hypothetical protein